jgi:hypothetical protein
MSISHVPVEWIADVFLDSPITYTVILIGLSFSEISLLIIIEFGGPEAVI